MEDSEFNENTEGLSEEQTTNKKQHPIALILFLLILTGLVIFAGFRIGSNLSKTPLNRYSVLLNDYYTARAKNDTNQIISYRSATFTDDTANLSLKPDKYQLFLYRVESTNIEASSGVILLFSLELTENQSRVSFLNEAQVIITNGDPVFRKIKILYKGKEL